MGQWETLLMMIMERDQESMCYSGFLVVQTQADVALARDKDSQRAANPGSLQFKCSVFITKKEGC